MEKLMNPKAAENVFSNSAIAHGFLKNGGAKYISAADMTANNPQRGFYLSKGISKGMPHCSGEMTVAGNAEQMMKNADKELLSGKLLSAAELAEIDADIALGMVEKAEKQTANNNINTNLAEMMAHKASHTY